MSRAATFLQEGKVLNITAGADYSAGDVVPLGVNAIGIALTDIASGDIGPVKVDGVYEIAAVNDSAFTVGEHLFWDTSAEKLTDTSTSNVAAGICVEAKAETGTTAKVLLTQGVGAAQVTGG